MILSISLPYIIVFEFKWSLHLKSFARKCAYNLFKVSLSIVLSKYFVLLLIFHSMALSFSFFFKQPLTCHLLCISGRHVWYSPPGRPGEPPLCSDSRVILGPLCARLHPHEEVQHCQHVGGGGSGGPAPCHWLGCIVWHPWPR